MNGFEDAKLIEELLEQIEWCVEEAHYLEGLELEPDWDVLHRARARMGELERDAVEALPEPERMGQRSRRLAS